MVIAMSKESAQSPIKGQFPDPKTIVCKDCIFRDKTVVNIGDKKIFAGITKMFCDIYREPPESTGKPHGVLFNNEDCEFYIKENIK